MKFAEIYKYKNVNKTIQIMTQYKCGYHKNLILSKSQIVCSKFSEEKLKLRYTNYNSRKKSSLKIDTSKKDRLGNMGSNLKRSQRSEY